MGWGIELIPITEILPHPPSKYLQLHILLHLQQSNMAEKSQKYNSEVWRFFEIVEGGDKTKCKFCNTTLSYKSNSTKSMWDHVKSKHAFQMCDEKMSVKERLGSRMKQSKLNFGDSPKFSKEKQESCYRYAAEVCIFKANIYLKHI